jgi:hypothetical protein
MIRNLTTYVNRRGEILGEFVYKGTAELKRGYGMCFNLDALTTSTGQTAADPWGRRGLKEVELPSQSNNLAFAGVLTQNYPANPSGKDQIVQLAMPGGCAMIANIEPTTINATQVSCVVPSALQVTSGYTSTAGLWAKAGLPGRGTALALQTMADASGAPRETAYIGDASYATATGTITATGKFTNAAVGDIVWVLSGGVANAAKAGKYYIKTVTSVNAVIIASTPGGDAVLDVTTNGGILAIATQPADEPLTLAYLYDGEESGLVEWDVPVSAAVTNPMVGGTTHLLGGVTLAAAHVPPLADATRIGMKKKVWLGGAITTGSYAITPVSKGLAPDGTIVVTATLQASLGMATLQWTGQKWDILSVNTAAEAT